VLRTLLGALVHALLALMALAIPPAKSLLPGAWLHRARTSASPHYHLCPAPAHSECSVPPLPPPVSQCSLGRRWTRSSTEGSCTSRQQVRGWARAMRPSSRCWRDWVLLTPLLQVSGRSLRCVAHSLQCSPRASYLPCRRVLLRGPPAQTVPSCIRVLHTLRALLQ